MIERATSILSCSQDANLQGGAPLSLKDGQLAEAPDKLLEAMRLTLEHSTYTSHPLFFNQLYGGPEPAGVAGREFLPASNAAGSGKTSMRRATKVADNTGEWATGADRTCTYIWGGTSIHCRQVVVMRAGLCNTVSCSGNLYS